MGNLHDQGPGFLYRGNLTGGQGSQKGQENGKIGDDYEKENQKLRVDFFQGYPDKSGENCCCRYEITGTVRPASPGIAEHAVGNDVDQDDKESRAGQGPGGGMTQGVNQSGNGKNRQGKIQKQED